MGYGQLTTYECIHIPIPSAWQYVAGGVLTYRLPRPDRLPVRGRATRSPPDCLPARPSRSPAGPATGFQAQPLCPGPSSSSMAMAGACPHVRAPRPPLGLAPGPCLAPVRRSRARGWPRTAGRGSRAPAPCRSRAPALPRRGARGNDVGEALGSLFNCQFFGFKPPSSDGKRL